MNTTVTETVTLPSGMSADGIAVIGDYGRAMRFNVNMRAFGMTGDKDNTEMHHRDSETLNRIENWGECR